VLELEQLLQAKHKELESVRDQLDAATRAAEDAAREKEVAEKKVARLERAKDDETSGGWYQEGRVLGGGSKAGRWVVLARNTGPQRSPRRSRRLGSQTWCSAPAASATVHKAVLQVQTSCARCSCLHVDLIGDLLVV
jgi:hypothetical protein